LRSDTVIKVIADYVNITGFKIINGASNGVYLNHSIGSTIKENIIDNFHYQISTGICLENSNENTISNNLITENFLASKLTSSNANIFLNNVIIDNVQSIWMGSCSNNYFDNNKCGGSSGFSSLYINNCSDNLFRRNEITSSQNWGMYLAFYSSGNIFSENTFSQNKADFIISYCAYNTFIHNNIVVSDIDNQDCLNTWDNSEEGNYWSNYNGIGAYTINSSYALETKPSRHTYGFDHDFHPLLTPYNIIRPSDPQTTLLSPQNATYNTDTINLTLAATNPISGTTYKLDGKWNVISQNTTLQWLSNGTHTLTTYATKTDGTLILVDNVVFKVDAIVNSTKPAEKVYNYNWSVPPPPNPIVKIQFPIQGNTYNTKNILLNFTVTEDEKYISLDTKITSLEYVLDPVYFEPLMTYTGWKDVNILSGLELTKFYSITLPNVADGNHSLYVRATATETVYQGFNVIVTGGAGVNFIVVNAGNSNSNQGSSSSSNSPQPTPAPTASIHTTLTPSPTGDDRSAVNFTLNGNVTLSQLSNITIATSQSANKTTVSFAVAGQSGTTGFSNVTIPKDQVPCGVTPTVYIDNEPCQNQGYTQDANNYYIWYTIHFSLHQVSINFIPNTVTPTPADSPIQPVQELNWLQIIVGFTVAIGIIAVIIVVPKLVLNKKDKTEDILK
jgi:parallel beta-helix repeat protein